MIPGSSRTNLFLLLSLSLSHHISSRFFFIACCWVDESKHGERFQFHWIFLFLRKLLCKKRDEKSCPSFSIDMDGSYHACPKHGQIQDGLGQYEGKSQTEIRRGSFTFANALFRYVFDLHPWNFRMNSLHVCLESHRCKIAFILVLLTNTYTHQVKRYVSFWSRSRERKRRSRIRELASTETTRNIARWYLCSAVATTRIMLIVWSKNVW